MADNASTSNATKKHAGGGWVAIAVLLAMLIWVRLRLVTDIPRSAFAEPATHPHQADTPGDNPAAPRHTVAQSPDSDHP